MLAYHIRDLNRQVISISFIGLYNGSLSTDGVNFASIYFRLRKYKERMDYACMRLCSAMMNILTNPCTRSEEVYEQLVVHD